MLIVDSAIQRIKIYAFAVSGMNRYQLAKAAGLTEGSTRNIHADDWNPTLDTIRSLERVIPADWVFEEPPILFNSTTIKKDKPCTPKEKKKKKPAKPKRQQAKATTQSGRVPVA